jgi:hypothetical protein
MFRDKSHTSTDVSALNCSSETSVERINKANAPLNPGYTGGIYAARHKASMSRLPSLNNDDPSAEERDEDDLEFERWILESADIVE